MATNNAYTPEIVNLAGGLDFVTPRPSVAPGALIDCFNYEVADALGYKRVDGIERFDGRPSISNCYGLLYAASCSTTLPAVGDALYVVGDTTQDAFAIVTATVNNVAPTPDVVYFYVFNMQKFLHMIASGLNVSDTGGTTYTLGNAQYAWHQDLNTDITGMIAGMINAYTNDAEPTVTSIASKSQGDSNNYTSAAGLQWWNDQLYAIVDFDSFIMTSVTQAIVPGDILSVVGMGSNHLLVRDVQVVSGSYAASNAVLKVSFSYLAASATTVGSYNVSTLRQTIPAAAAVSIIRGGTTVSSIGVVGSTGTVLSNRMAGLYRSWGIDTLPAGSLYSKQGWQEIDLGYLINYTNVAQNSGSQFTIAGRNSQPTSTAITSAVAGQTSLSGNPTPSAGGATSSDNDWHVGSSTLTSVLSTVDDFTLATYLPQGLAPHSGTSVTTAISGWDFSSLPADALISGLEVTVVATDNSASSPAKVQVTPVSNFLTGAVSKSTNKLAAVTTSGTFVIPAIGASVNVTVSSAANLAVNNQVYIHDASYVHAITGTITAIAGSVISVTVNSIPHGSATQTMATAAKVLTINKLGGSADLWGTTNITVQALQDSSFALNVAGIGATNATAGILSIDQIYITVYYQLTSSVYYFWNGTDDVTGVVTTFTIDSGDFATDTAAGIAQVSNVQAYSTAARQNIQDGDQIRSAPAGGGVCFGTVSGDGVYAGLPSLSKLQAQKSQYEFIIANFFGNQSWDAIYGVSGAGRAFTYDGFYFRYIFTGLNDTLDLPRHVAFHNFHLCLQYATGAVLASVTGSPESFDGTLGAAEFDTGDTGTGLLRMNGTTLGLFCKSSIQALNGTDTTNFSLSILNPYEGAIEYTVVDCGKPVYCSYKGISTFDQTSAYGSFLGNRLSAHITPWLLPRLTNQPVPVETNLFSLGYAQPSTQGVLFAIPVRNKNQYRVYFKDGFCLTLTFMGQEATPVFTIQQFAYTRSALPFFLIPLAHSSAVDSNGRDRNHLSFYDPINLAVNNNTDYQYVYELDRGWGFGSYPIQAYFTTTHNFFDNPLEWANPRKIRVHGLSKGASTITAAVSSNYGAEDFQFGAGYTPPTGPAPIPTARSNAVPQNVSLPRDGFSNSPYTFTFDYQPATNIANVSKLGRSFSMQFVTNPTTIEPPHAAQALFMQIIETKGDV